MHVPIFDADNHLYETREAFTKFLRDCYKDVVRYVDIDGRTKILVNGRISEYIRNPTFDVVARPVLHGSAPAELDPIFNAYRAERPEGLSDKPRNPGRARA
jgi:hypothetical protein